MTSSASGPCPTSPRSSLPRTYSPSPVNPSLANLGSRKPQHYYAPGEVCEDQLYGSHKPKIDIIQEETPRRRQMIDLTVAGMNHTEVAAVVGCNPITVSRVVRQPWAQKRIVEKIEQNAMEPIKALIESTARESVVRLASLAGDEDLKFKHPKLYTEINQSFLDRYLGKAPQVVESRTTEPEKLSDDELANNIATLRARVGATS